jgi:two-component system cell cycle sensor histidine kinase PleC
MQNPARLKDQQITDFANETVHYFKQMPMTRVNIYSNSGALLLTINSSSFAPLSTASTSPDTSFVAAQLRRQGIMSKLLPQVLLADGKQGALVQTTSPLNGRDPSDAQQSEGMLELIYNISSVRDEVRTCQILGSGAIILMFVIFLYLLLIMSRKAENIITKQHEANQELAQAAEAAQAENREKSQFLANVSHELRTPLNAIIGFSEILKNELMATIPEQKYHDYLLDINSSGVHLLSLINDILDYSKAEAGKLELEISEVNANKMIQNCMRLVSPRADAGQVSLVESLPKEALVFNIDSKKFKQIFLNLLSNAVKFTPPGGSVHVTAWRNIKDDMITFEVRDTGIGIAPKDISRAMAPFGQVDNTLKRKYEGTGLGLPLTKKFVELMNGKFNIESELNKGTTITFTLPCNIIPVVAEDVKA